MNRIVRASAAIAAIGALAGASWCALDAISKQPVRRVVFTGSVEKIARSDLEAFAQAIHGSAASSASLAEMREAARRIPWVRDASVRRRFPDAVEVAFETHEALARWSDDALVSTRGEIFRVDFDGPLPRFRGDEAAVPAIVSAYPGIVRALRPLPLGIAEVRLSTRGAWEVALDSGLVLALGHGDIESRLARFAAAWPLVSAKAREARRADLRYGNGFALQVEPLSKKK